MRGLPTRSLLMDYLGCLARIGSWSNEKILRQQDEHEYEDARAYLYVLLAKQRKRHDMQQHARRHQARKLIMESTLWRSCVDLQWYMDSLLQFAGYLDTPLRMSTRSYISSKEVFSSLNNSDSRPSHFLFQIARGSGATLSECTFSRRLL